MVIRLMSFFLFFGVIASALAVIETYEFDTATERERYQHFTEVLRCPKCQNQNLSGSNSPIAEDLRRELAKQIQSGNSDETIIEFMVNRYGDYVLYDPQFKRSTWILWVAPAVIFCCGLLLILTVINKRSNKQKTSELTSAEQQRLSSLLHTQQSDNRESEL